MQRSLVLFSLLGSLAICRADAVRLQINGPDGKPVAGAQVRVLEVKMPGSNMQVKDLTSDAKGSAAFDSQYKLMVEPTQNGANQSMMVVRIIAPNLAVAVFQMKSGDNSVALLPGRSLEGVAVDKDAKPVGNVELMISSLPFTPLMTRGMPMAGIPIRLPDELAISTKSNEQGQWKFDSVPDKGTVDIEAKDARFKRAATAIGVDQKDAKLRLTQGAVIKGRLLKPDGTGAAGIKIFTGDISNQFTTDGEGRFDITGIGSDSVRLQLSPFVQGTPFMVTPRQITNIKEGEVLDIGDWKAEAGIQLKGRLVDAATQKPIADASITASATQNAINAHSDKSGAFELTVPKDTSNVSVDAEGYVSYWSSELPKAREGVIDFGAIELKTGQKVEGVVTDETNNLIGNVSLYAESEGNRTFASTSDDGKFTFGAMKPGTYTIKSDGLEFVGDTTLKIENGKVPALKLVVKDSANKGGKHDIAGRVVDGEGKAVAGANIALLIRRSGSSYSVENVTSEADGSFKGSVTGFVTNVSIQSVASPGFLRNKDQEKSEAAGGNWTVNISLQKSGTLKGRVVDGGGQAVKGAYVATRSGDELPVITDDNGAFTLPDVPIKAVTLLASDGASLGSFEVKQEGAAIQIALPAVAALDAQGKEALVNQAIEKGALDSNWKENWSVLGSERIEKILGNQSGGEGKWQWLEFLQELARREPEALLGREAELRARSNTEAATELDRLVLLAKASSTNPAARQQVRTWLDGQQKERRTISAETITRLLSIAQISAKMDAKETGMWLDYATQIAEQLAPDTIAENSWQWSGLALRVSPTALQTLSDNWAASAKVGLYSNAMEVWLADNDIKAAKLGWEELQKSIEESAKKQTGGEGGDNSYQLARARANYARLLARTEPKAAFALVSSLEEYERPRVFADIAREAVRLKQFDVAREILTELSNVRSGDSEVMSQAAGVAEQFDAAFAKPLWEKAYEQAKPSTLIENGERWYPSLSTYAQERAAKWPGESRILLEREWAKRLVWNQQPAPESWDPNASGMKDVVEAMAHLSPQRALEMAEQVPDKNRQRALAYGQIGIVLLKK